jgi:hypothetical protein
VVVGDTVGDTADMEDKDFVVLERFDGSSGAPDPTFGTGGVVTSSFTGVDAGVAVAAGPGGSVFVGGKTTPNSSSKLTVFKYRSDGTLDSSYGAGGLAHFGADGIQVKDATIAVDATGR